MLKIPLLDYHPLRSHYQILKIILICLALPPAFAKIFQRVVMCKTAARPSSAGETTPGGAANHIGISNPFADRHYEDMHRRMSCVLVSQLKANPPQKN